MTNTTRKNTIDSSVKPAPNALQSLTSSGSVGSAMLTGGPFVEYMTDAMQRTILFWDVLRQRSSQYYAQKEKAIPHVLSFDRSEERRVAKDSRSPWSPYH